ncbi:NAD(P)H-dependent oxidoreductase [Enterobacteriaceae bacterium BIT-l23]|uniref:NAD(P)H-dependent oxidoreductase n=1 Tax=Jejubacter calystegiae TaxID=2579935 RepID=A0A4P8YNY6_9ENTR|nr:NAD(P)H-dependent oxidoreductase [Jejubacter calystegiae]NUU68213.1 NAD(P)H-dependent oxidoreductase [Enterobacteriaceae bacterium BIT-l23]QCT21856.1 NAD(P)H-dependent oxidoreductase [Jejubacter calystegiae]
MHALIVTAHPHPDSLTHSIAAGVARGITESGPHRAEIANLAQEGFRPEFTREDFAAFNAAGALPEDVRAEQTRIDSADALVLVFPVYWWSMPALMKGWIDRVFSAGWAYEETADGRLIKKLRHLPVHLVAIGAANMKTWEKHRYQEAMKVQIEEGIFNYCGAPVMSSSLLLSPEYPDTNVMLQDAHRLGQKTFNTQQPVAV